MHLVRDLIDKAVEDRNGRHMGRVDRVIAEGDGSSALRVVAIEIGASALGTRLSPLMGRYVAGWLHVLGVDEGQPIRIHVSNILDIADAVRVDLAFGETPASNLERKLRRLIGALPGATR